MDNTILLTGSAGFIGFHVSQLLLSEGARVVGLDNLNAYYDPSLKRARLDRLVCQPGFRDVRGTVEDGDMVTRLIAEERPDTVIHLAAQAGVRHSLEAPQDYIDNNITGFLNILQACRKHPVRHLVYASTSSVYGLNGTMPFHESQSTEHPISLYAVTKKANEMMAHAYGHLFAVPTTGLRFFTVYGPWGRPDMALFKFTDAILADRPIQVFNNGKMARDFTYVDDIANAVTRIARAEPRVNPDWSALNPDPATSGTAPYRIFNIGNSNSVNLMDYVAALEQALGRKARIEYLPMQPGDVARTWADTSALAAAVGYRPATSVADGVAAFVAWYRDYHNV
jgi:UDP-glucuronate 4-epimerase